MVGESGCGKSTLGRLLTMIEVPTGGELYHQGQDLLKPDVSARNRAARRSKSCSRILRIAQPAQEGRADPRGAAVINTSLSARRTAGKALEMMAKVGLKTEHYDRYPHMFSGGQRQRIAIARGLMLNPDVVIADEPVSALDVSVRAQVLNLMMDLQQELGLSYVFISHDLSVVEHRRRGDGDVPRRQGKRAAKSRFNNPRHPYTRRCCVGDAAIESDMRRERIKPTGELPSPMRSRRRAVRSMPAAAAPSAPAFQLQPQLKQYGEQMVACFAVDQDEHPGREAPDCFRINAGMMPAFFLRAFHLPQ
ncbi:ATP-binding cassette domain-containing protein [Serratia ureilytica]